MQIAFFCRPPNLLSPRSTSYVPHAGRKRREDSIQVLYDFEFSTDHHAIPALKPPHSAARTDIHIVNMFCGQVIRTSDIIDVVRVTSVDQRVTGVEARHKLGDRFFDRTRRYHQPNRSRLLQFLHQIRQVGRAYGVLFDQFLDWLRRSIEDDTLVPALKKAPCHVGSHPAQADHSELHTRSYSDADYCSA